MILFASWSLAFEWPARILSWFHLDKVNSSWSTTKQYALLKIIQFHYARGTHWPQGSTVTLLGTLLSSLAFLILISIAFLLSRSQGQLNIHSNRNMISLSQSWWFYSLEQRMFSLRTSAAFSPPAWGGSQHCSGQVTEKWSWSPNVLCLESMLVPKFLLHDIIRFLIV